jgi:hypothetical protein
MLFAANKVFVAKGGQLRLVKTEKSGRLTMLKRLLLSGAALFSLSGAALAGEAQSIGVNLTGGRLLN